VTIAPSVLGLALEAETAQRAFDISDKAALAKALQSGAVRVKVG
jgi:hypothetical protein